MKIRLISGQGDQKEIEFDGDQKEAAESYLLQDWPEKWKIVEFIDPIQIQTENNQTKLLVQFCTSQDEPVPHYSYQTQIQTGQGMDKTSLH